MTVDEIIAECRIRLDDLGKGTPVKYQYAEANLINWINEAQMEACRRARILSDSTLTVNVIAGTSAYDLPDETILVRRAKLSLEELPLSFATSRDMDEDVAGWESHTGTPTDIITDMESSRFIIYPTPIVNDTLNMVVIREPMPITSTSSILEIPKRFHYGLVDWVLFKAYQVRDADKESRSKSVEHLEEFIREFGERSSAKDEIFNIRNMPYSNTDGYF